MLPFAAFTMDSRWSVVCFAYMYIYIYDIDRKRGELFTQYTISEKKRREFPSTKFHYFIVDSFPYITISN